jgi:hypothetical protein
MDQYLRERIAIRDRGADRLVGTVCYTPELQGPPDSGHGGGTTALLFELARILSGETEGKHQIPRPVRIDVTFHRPMPLEVTLEAEAVVTAEGWLGRICQEGKCLVEAVIRSVPGPLLPPAVDRRPWAAEPAGSFRVPAYQYCLGCGLDNPRGAQVRFEYDDTWMWKRLTPQTHFRSADGSLVPAYHTIVGDELGWWLAAVRLGECGLSGKLSVTLGPPTPHGAPLVAVGSRAGLVSTDPKGRVWQVPVAILTEDGAAAAAAEVQFVASRAFTRLMLPRFRWTDDLTDARRIFPRYRQELE